MISSGTLHNDHYRKKKTLSTFIADCRRRSLFKMNSLPSNEREMEMKLFIKLWNKCRERVQKKKNRLYVLCERRVDIVCDCKIYIWVNIEDDNEMGSLKIVREMHTMHQPFIVECSTADVKLIRFDIMLEAGNRFESQYVQTTMWHFLHSSPFHIGSGSFVHEKVLSTNFILIFWTFCSYFVLVSGNLKTVRV